jgi:hypothetical protein
VKRGLAGQLREQVQEAVARGAQEPAVRRNPSSACATHSVTTSASVTIRLAFFLQRGRRSSAVQNTTVSSRSRSASIVARPFGVDGAIESTADFDLRSQTPAHDPQVVESLIRPDPRRHEG